MMDDIIASTFDGHGNKMDMTIKDCYRTYMDMVKLLYHDYMARVVDGDFDNFKRLHMNATERMIDVVHSRYADHVEGIRMDLFKEKKIHDPRRFKIDG